MQKKTFRPNGIASGARAVRSNQTRDYPVDRLVEVTGYDLASATMYARDVSNNVNLKVKIAQREGGNLAAPAADKKWSGNRIDIKMQDAIPVGEWVVLERCQGNQKVMEGGKSVLPITANWVVNVGRPDPNNPKVFNALMTVKAYRNAVTSVQVWEDKAIDINDQASIAVLGDKFDEVLTAFKNREPVIRHGIQFRLLKQIEEAKGDKPPVYQVVNASNTLDWFREEDAPEEDIGQPLSKAQFFDFVNAYMDYVYGPEDESEPGLFPKEEFEKLRIEIMPYKVIRAGSIQFNPNLAIAEPEAGRPPSILYQLANTPTRYSLDDPTLFVGQNWGVRGIAQLVPDQVEKVNGQLKEVKVNLIKRLFVHGVRANILGMVSTSDGARPKVHPELDRQVEASLTNEAGVDNAGLVQSSGDVLGGAGVVGMEFDGGFGDMPPPVVAPPVEKVPAPVAPAPVAAPPVESVTPAAAPATGGSRFGRSRGNSSL